MEIWGITLYPYGAMIALGIAGAYLVVNKYKNRFELSDLDVDKLLSYVLIGGIVGARAYHVADLWSEYYASNLIKTLYVWEGGLGILGGLIGGALALALYGLWYKVNFAKLASLVALGMPLAQAIGRWGNYFNQEIIGVNNEPLFLYESLLNLLLFGVLWRLLKSQKTKLILGSYLIGYGVIRLVLEPMRSDDVIWQIGNWSMASILSATMVLTGLWIIKYNKKLRLFGAW